MARILKSPVISTIPGDDEVGTVVYIPVLVGTGGTVLVVLCDSISIVVVMAGLGHVTLSPRGPSQPLSLHMLATVSIQPLNTSLSPFVKLRISVGLVSHSKATCTVSVVAPSTSVNCRHSLLVVALITDILATDIPWRSCVPKDNVKLVYYVL